VGFKPGFHKLPALPASMGNFNRLLRITTPGL